MKAAIIDRGRGPEIAGTRITVYDILDYSQQGWHHSSIALWFNLSSKEVLTALRYIEEATAEIEALVVDLVRALKDREAREKV